MKIYTKTGDAGETGLFGGGRVGKDDARVEAYGQVDELNSVLGLARAEGLGKLDPLAQSLQDQLFTVGEKLKLSVRAEAFSKPFNVVAQVVRYNSDPRFPVGYGLRFEDLDQAVASEIQAAVDQQNKKGTSSHKAAR